MSVGCYSGGWGDWRCVCDASVCVYLRQCIQISLRGTTRWLAGASRCASLLFVSNTINGWDCVGESGWNKSQRERAVSNHYVSMRDSLDVHRMLWQRSSAPVRPPALVCVLGWSITTFRTPANRKFACVFFFRFIHVFFGEEIALMSRMKIYDFESDGGGGDAHFFSVFHD